MPTASHRVLAAAAILAVLAVSFPRAAIAEPAAAYATADSLAREGEPQVLDVSALARYASVTEPRRAGGLHHLGTFDVRTRMLLGTAPAYAVGLDASAGVADTGFVYGVTGYPLGVGAQWGDGNALALTTGVGLDRVGNGVPTAASVPSELSVATSVGPLRGSLWLRPSWIVDEAARKKGATLRFVDEFEAGVLVRLSPQHRYWSTTNAGGGLSLGVQYREFMQTRYVGVLLGFNFVGARG